MIRLLLILNLSACHLFDDGVIAKSCEETPAACGDTDTPRDFIPDTAVDSGEPNDRNPDTGTVDTGQPPLLVSWEVTDFGNDVFLSDFGWEHGYLSDSWYAMDGAAYPMTDDGLFDEAQSSAYVYGVGESPDNWVLHPGEFAIGTIRATVLQTDDDSCGIVLGHRGSSFALLGASADRLPPPMFETDGPTAFLLSVVDGQVVNWTTVSIREWGGSQKGSNSLVLTQVDGELIGSVNDHQIRLTSDPIVGRAGLWAYQSGYIESEQESCGFLDVEAFEE